jgi:hypothetical protein
LTRWRVLVPGLSMLSDAMAADSQCFGTPSKGRIE